MAVVAWLGSLRRVSLQVSQQWRLSAECLIAHRTCQCRRPALHPEGIPLLDQLDHPVTLAAGELASFQMGLLVIGQTGQVMELLVTLVALVDDACPVAALVQEQVGFGFKASGTLEAGVGFAGAWLLEAGFWGAGLFFMVRLKLQAYSSRFC